MSLAILVVFEMKLLRIFPARHCLQIVIVRILLTPFFNQIFGQRQIALFAGRFVKPDQGQLDLGMTAVAALLTWFCAKERVDMIGIAAERVEQLGITSRLVMGDRGLHQVAGTVHFVPVA